jgi:type I restriction enzyme M protein
VEKALSMSEELLQTAPITMGRYQFYKLGASTLTQLRNQKIIKSRFSPDIATKKLDGLIILPGGDVKAVIEYKQPSELRTPSGINKAIQQELEVAKQLCKVLIVTSGDKTIWINAINGNRILSESGQELVQVFDAKSIVEGRLSSEQLADFELLLDKIDYSLTADNDRIEQPAVLDPSSLARSMWQKIWINTGKEPEKCLYNVVELFVFKFLSDVGVLRSHNNFSYVFSLYQTDSAKEALKHYANTCRKEIRELFPEGKDGTTIINGTIFVNEKGAPNLSQSRLFGEVLTQLQDYDSEYGSFKYIKKDFKTRLYESFLRQSAGVRFLGQYFTPRNVVEAMVAMSNAPELRTGSRICDPFCGVGGFILEVITANPHLLKEFEPVNGQVQPSITLLGFDKGTDEKEDERTIILAKANMLIYFSDLLVKYNSKDHLRAFSEGAFNKVFHLIRSNIGTFERVQEPPFDLILTNPPYVTSGSSSLKAAIEEEGLSNNYTAGGRGTESLALEWIIRHLKPSGQALVVVPDGLLNQSNIIKFARRECFVQGIISLPMRTFYSTPKKTYILILKRKYSPQDEQKDPVFTYLVSEIGESRDARRIRIDANDLTDATIKFNQFKGSPNYFSSDSPRCKIISFDEFQKHSHWMIDRWWSTAEKLSIGIEDETGEVSEDEFIASLRQINTVIDTFLQEYQSIADV